jgi:MFS superfamily sulfate permease-like transporter
VNPDAAVCAMVAAAVGPLASGNAELYWSLSVAVTFLAGLFCIVASFFRLGIMADFLSRPILTGFLNGVAISICLGQIDKVLGFSIKSERVVPQLLEILGKLPQTQVPTLTVGAASMGLLFLMARLSPRLPSALITLIAAAAAVALLRLDQYGVAILGPVPAGLPLLRLPAFPLGHTIVAG